ncbi:hypothetical protein [Larkinella soli]|uniref:hypothetical protein n=1 Tax=Larkinella soli TaxID=1770527 RepID=UPI000FFB7E76|nr:hypothetical protein [Larkinella soli]
MKKLVLTLACFASLSAVYAASSSPSAPAPVVRVVASDSTDLTQYAGKYKFEGLPFEFLTIGVKDGKLTVSTGAQEGELVPMKEPDKYDASGQATLTFTRDGEKKVTGITLEAQGAVFEGKKES